MSFVPVLTVLEESQVSPPPATTGCKSLQLTFFDLLWLRVPHPVHHVFIYELSITKTQFLEDIVPNLKQSLSKTIQHFLPFAGKLVIFPTSNRIPEIRYEDGDSIDVTIAESNRDFKDLIGRHPRECDKFYDLIPVFGPTIKESDYVKIPVYAVQVTLFPDHGISIGVTCHHSLCDASTAHSFKNTWASIAKTGSDESFLANGTLPVYDRLVNNPTFDASYLKKAKVETYDENYRALKLTGPTDKVRATFIMTQTAIKGLKKLVATKLPELTYVSSLTVTCAYIWSILSKFHDSEISLFVFAVDCRSRMDPPLPAGYFGNCIMPCKVFEKTSKLKEEDGFLTAAKSIGEKLHMTLTEKDKLVRDLSPIGGPNMKITGLAGSLKVTFYDLDFGFGKPVKHEMVSTDHGESISLSACRDSNENFEVGVCLSASDMEVFGVDFNSGLKSFN